MSKRNAILAAATRLFSQNGFEGAAMAELSSLTGAATGTIFHHFKNKEDLFLNVLENVRTNILDEFDDGSQDRQGQSGLEMVMNAVDRYLHIAVSMGDRFMILHRHFPYRMASTNPVCRNHLEAIYTALLDIFEAGIKKGMADGSVMVDNPRKTAMVLFAMVDGIVRLHTYRIYDAGTLHGDLIIACRRLLSGGS